MSHNSQPNGDTSVGKPDPEEPYVPVGKVMDKYRDKLRVLGEERRKALAEAEVALKLLRR
jgi:hypothetical protein